MHVLQASRTKRKAEKSQRVQVCRQELQKFPKDYLHFLLGTYEIRRTEYTSPNDVMELTNEEIRKWFLFFFKKYSG